MCNVYTVQKWVTHTVALSTQYHLTNKTHTLQGPPSRLVTWFIQVENVIINIYMFFSENWGKLDEIIKIINLHNIWQLFQEEKLQSLNPFSSDVSTQLQLQFLIISYYKPQLSTQNKLRRVQSPILGFDTKSNLRSMLVGLLVIVPHYLIERRIWSQEGLLQPLLRS